MSAETSHITAIAPTDRLRPILTAGNGWGGSSLLDGQRALFEFVSAPPNAPLTVGHSRGGVIGSALALLFEANGAKVEREFYVNDSEDSRPLRALARAILKRYRTLCGVTDSSATEEGLSEAAVAELASALKTEKGDAWAKTSTADVVPLVERFALERIGDGQKTLLDTLGVSFDTWFSERKLCETGAVGEVIDLLLASEDAKRHDDGSVWLLSSRRGDESDRTLLRADGSATYLAGDLAYHRDKFARGFDRLIDVWGADHAGYIARTKAGLSALGFDSSRLDVLLFQPVRILRDGTEVRGENGGPLLSELVGQTGPNPLRFALLLKPASRPVDIDLDAIDRSDSPLRRIEKAIQIALMDSSGSDAASNDDLLALLESSATARGLLIDAEEFPNIVRRSIDELCPHFVAQYAAALADRFLGWQSGESTPATLALSATIGIVLRNALRLLGITTSEAISGSRGQ